MYNYESDSDNEDENEIIYEPEEESVTKYNIVLCELFDREIHGGIYNISEWLVLYRFKELDSVYIYDFADELNAEYLHLAMTGRIRNHNIYRNYINIIKKDNYIKPEIAQCIYLESGHCVCILKTIWIRLIQRKWKNIIKEREEIIRKRKNPLSIRKREITGMWPGDISQMPVLKGMLYRLK
jgi:hypothetical protein